MLKLTENVIVSPREAGSGFDLNHPEEPKHIDSWVSTPWPHWQGFGGTELLAETDNPDAVLTPAVPPAP